MLAYPYVLACCIKAVANILVQVNDFAIEDLQQYAQA